MKLFALLILFILASCNGAGGGGAGGSIYVKNLNPIPATISLNARGGAGGNGTTGGIGGKWGDGLVIIISF